MSVDPRPPLDNAELRQYRALLEVAEAISVHRDLKSLLRDLTSRLQLVVKFDGVNIVLYDAESNMMRMNVLETTTFDGSQIPTELPIEDAPAGTVWQTQQPFLITDLGAYEKRYSRVIPGLKQRGIKTAYVLPLTSAGRRLGAIGFGSLHQNAWGDHDQELFQQVAKLVAVAVDNTLNFENASAAEAALARERDRLRLLLEINNAVVSRLGLRELLDVISTCLRQAIPHDAALLSLYDPETSTLHLQALDLQIFGNVSIEEGTGISAENTPEGEAIASGQPVLVGPVLDLNRFSSPWVRKAADNGVKSGCAVPLISHDRTLGALSVVSLSENAFNEADVALLMQCANQIAIAVENALNFERARDTEQQAARERDRIRLLLEINNAVVSHLDLSELVKTVSASLRDVMPHDAAGIALYEPELNQLREYKNVSYKDLETFREGDVIPLEGTPAGKVFLTGQPLLIKRPDPAAYPADPFSQQPVAGSPKSACLALLSAHGRKLGIVGISSTQEERFTDQDLELFSNLAGQVAIALENSLNFERARNAEQEVKRQFERLRLMLDVNNATVSHLDLRELVRVTAACLREVLGHEIVGLSLYDEKNNQLRAYAYDSPDKRLSIQQGTLVPMEGSLGGLALTSGQPIFYNRVDPTASVSDFNKQLIEAGIESGGCVPLIVHGRKLGVLGVGSFREDAFPEEHQQLLGQIAGQIAIAVDNALNFQRAREAEQEATHQSDRLSTVLQINNAVVSQLNLRELLQVVSRSLRKTVHNDTTGVALYDPESHKLRVVMTDFPEQMNLVEESYLIELEGSAMGVAYTSGEPVFLDQFDLERFPSDFTRRSYDAGLRSACNIPLIAHGRKLGALGVASKRPFAFSAEDRELLCQSANQIAIAVENALNFERTRAAEEEANRQSDRLQLLLQVNNAIASALDLPSLFQAVSASLRQVFRHDYSVMGLYDDQQDILRVHLLDRGEEIDFLQEGQIATLVDTPVGLAIRTKQPVVTGPDYLKQFPAEVVRRAVSQGIRANCSVPLLRKNRIIGAMSIASKTECAFTKADGELFMQIAGQVAIAVENALNFERIRTAEEEANRQSDRRQLLLEINNAMVAQLDLRSLIQVISVSLRRISLHDVVGLALYDPDTNQLRAYAYESLDKQFAIEEGTPIPLESSLSGSAFMSGQPVFHDRIDEQRFQSGFSDRFRSAGLKSGGVVPLIAHGRKLGTLAVASYREANLNEDEKELLCQVANQVALAVENALAFREIEALKNKLTSEKLYLEDEIRTQHNFEELIGESQTFKRILKQVETVAPTGSTVLICGETGTGKELIARAIHDLSDRRERTLVKINCAAIPTGLLESELFGHEKGAFTGAISQRVGRFELANRGSLFLDEVGDIPLDLQPKLLRVLQEQEFERLGSTRTQKVDVRLIAATNCDLEQMVADRKYRSDLFYRLNVFPITIPPLRQRREDIPALTRFFTQRYARRLKKQITSIPAEIMTALTNYHWPGNVRELEHFIERAVILTRGDSLEVSLAELKSSEPAPVTELATLHDAEREHILRALEETNWIVGGPQGAAARLGMKRTTLQSKMQKLGIGRQS